MGKRFLRRSRIAGRRMGNDIQGIGMMLGGKNRRMRRFKAKGGLVRGI